MFGYSDGVAGAWYYI